MSVDHTRSAGSAGALGQLLVGELGSAALDVDAVRLLTGDDLFDLLVGEREVLRGAELDEPLGDDLLLGEPGAVRTGTDAVAVVADRGDVQVVGRDDHDLAPALRADLDGVGVRARLQDDDLAEEALVGVEAVPGGVLVEVAERAGLGRDGRDDDDLAGQVRQLRSKRVDATSAPPGLVEVDQVRSTVEDDDVGVGPRALRQSGNGLAVGRERASGVVSTDQGVENRHVVEFLSD